MRNRRNILDGGGATRLGCPSMATTRTHDAGRGTVDGDAREVRAHVGDGRRLDETEV